MTQQHLRAFYPPRSSLFCVVAVAFMFYTVSFAFVAAPFPNRVSSPVFSRGVRLFALPDIDKMKAGEMRKELESYGISTKSLFEKKEFAEALKKARSEGKTPKKQTSSASSTSGKAASDTSSKSRDQRIKEETEKINKMKVGEIKKELQGLGVSTKSFFEKSEFVKALAVARVDGVKDKARGRVEEEEYDPSYRDVVMKKFKSVPEDTWGPAIDITNLCEL